MCKYPPPQGALRSASVPKSHTLEQFTTVDASFGLISAQILKHMACHVLINNAVPNRTLDDRCKFMDAHLTAYDSYTNRWLAKRAIFDTNGLLAV
jgi:hypothetical protein